MTNFTHSINSLISDDIPNWYELRMFTGKLVAYKHEPQAEQLSFLTQDNLFQITSSLANINRNQLLRLLKKNGSYAHTPYPH